MPSRPQIYHITHVDNLPSIIQAGGLWSDAQMIAQGGPAATIGMSKIKQRRLELPVDCYPGSYVGNYVPFYFCPRSVMLYLIHKHHPELQFTGGQEPILHLEADLYDVMDWAAKAGVRWAFSLSNAGAHYAEFRKQRSQLDQIDWDAVQATIWSGVKEAKQAEFLMHDSFPWHLVRRIGVMSSRVGTKVHQILGAAKHRPSVTVLPNWYY